MASPLWTQEYQAQALVAQRDAAIFTSDRRTPPSGISPSMVGKRAALARRISRVCAQECADREDDHLRAQGRGGTAVIYVVQNLVPAGAKKMHFVRAA